MAQIIPFPGTVVETATKAAIAVAAAIKPLSPPPTKEPTFSVVRHIRKGKRVPRQNRQEDDYAITIAKMAKNATDNAHAIALSAPNSLEHLMALGMAGIAKELPRNNLRVFTTGEDVLLGLWRLWRQVRIANLEWELCNERRLEAALQNDEVGKVCWSKREDEADDRRWKTYERLVRVPAATLSDATRFKLDKRLQRGMGSIEWMRKYKPEIAAIIDEEMQRLTAAKEAKHAARLAKRQGGPS